MRRVVIVGFGTAGLRAALSAKAQNPGSNVIVVSEEQYLTYSRCGLPFVIGGDIKSFENLIVVSNAILQKSGIDLILGFRAIDVIGNTLYIDSIDGKESRQINFDSLVIATGSKPFIPHIKNVNINNVFTLRSIDDGIKIMKSLNNIRHFAIVGAGAIGLECAEAFSKRGLTVSVIELMPKVLPNILDHDMALLIQEDMVKHNVNLKLGKRVEEILGSNSVKGLVVNGEIIDCDAVLIATGVKADVVFAKNIGVELGSVAIKTDDFMETSKTGVYAAGDCVETKNLITSKPFTPYLGTVAYRQGNVAGANAAGGSMVFPGSLGSIVLRIFDYEIGFTGLTNEQAEKEGLNTIVSKVKWYTKAEYFPHHGDITVKLIFDANSRKLLGCQIVGTSDVAQRINLASMAISMGAKVDDLIKLDTCYSPPVADVIEPIVKASEIALKRFKK
ncbi:MAG: FAD-dependent oxidoreductase [Candidatus Methanomethylicia archaeon]